MARNRLVTFGLKDETIAYFKAKAKEENRSLSQVFRLSIESYMRDQKLAKQK